MFSDLTRKTSRGRAGASQPPRRQGNGGFTMKAVEIVVTKVVPRQAPTMEKVVLRDGRTTWVKASMVNRLVKAGMVLHLA